MVAMKRLYKQIIEEHLKEHQQMVFIAGPRQVGKTTLAKDTEKITHHFNYYNWDNMSHREQLIYDANAIFEDIPFNKVSKTKPIVVFDEVHKYKKWKSLIKGLFDTYKENSRIIVTGSAKLNIYQKFGDSLMGRYFLYRIHPFSIGELHHKKPSKDYFLHNPSMISHKKMEALLSFGGFPDPYLKQDKRYYTRWQSLRKSQLFTDDIRELSNIQDIGLMELLYELLQEYSGQLMSYSNLARKIKITSPTVKKWIGLFEQIYYCFKVSPWQKNISRSLLKEPKMYLFDWSLVRDPGAKIENFVASHLLKAVHFWTDCGLGEFGLYFLRDKDKREVDFLIVQDGSPWLIIEVKSSGNKSLNPQLKYFQEQTKAPHAIQIAYDMPHEDIDFRDLGKPMIIPMSTFLSQLP